MIVECKLTRASNWLQQHAAVMQPCSNQWRYGEDGIVIGSSLKTHDRAETVIPVMNLTDEPCMLHRGTRIGEAHVIIKCNCVGGILPTPPAYFEDSEDSEDEG